LVQISSDIEENKKQKNFGPDAGEGFNKALAKAQSWYNKYKTADEIEDKNIPE